MTTFDDLLVEIGTEELPPKALRTLSDAFAAELVAELDGAGLAHGTAAPYATPRRLAVLVPAVPATQPDRDVERRGPPLARAFDENDRPTKAALGFARSVGVEVDRLVRIETGDGAWLGYRTTKAGATLASLLPGMVERALARLPVPRRMRWADSDTEFVRPVHWVVLMHGAEAIEAEILGVSSGRTTRGHRFHHPDDIALENANGYVTTLRHEGHVVAGFEERMETIREQVRHGRRSVLGGRALDRPGAPRGERRTRRMAGRNHRALRPRASSSSPTRCWSPRCREHQRYFPVAGADRRTDAALHRDQQHREPQPRDGARRQRTGRSAPAERRRVLLRHGPCGAASNQAPGGTRMGVIFQRKLGSLHAKSERVSALAGRVARAMGGVRRIDRGPCRGAPVSSRNAISSPRWWASFRSCKARWGASTHAWTARRPRWRRRSAKSTCRASPTTPSPAPPPGRAIAIADKLDTIVGCLSVGQVPTGDKDPFALRRAALGALRIMIEGELDLELGDDDRGRAGVLRGGKPSEDRRGTVRELCVRRRRPACELGRRGGARRPRRKCGGSWSTGCAPTSRIDRFRPTSSTRCSRRSRHRPPDFANRVRAVEAFRRPSPRRRASPRPTSASATSSARPTQAKIDVPGDGRYRAAARRRGASAS